MLLTDHVALVSLTSNVPYASCWSSPPRSRSRCPGLRADLGRSGTVDPFGDLNDVPTDYYTLIIFDEPQELLDRLVSAVGYERAVALVRTFDSDECTGIHTNAFNRQPFALVRASDDAWTTVVSHEVLEMLRIRTGTA